MVIYPDESDGAPGIILVNQAIRSSFANQAPGPIEVRNEYVDASRLQDAEFMRAQVSLIRQKYAGRKIDLVMAGLSSGLDFALQYRDQLFPGVPIVFVAVDEREIKARRLPPDVTGVPIRMDLPGTLELALKFHPDTRRVFVVAGSAPFDLSWGDEARRTFLPYEDRLEFAYLLGLPMDELLKRVADLPKQSIIYYLNIHRDGTGESFIPAQALERLAAKANAPIYGHVDTYIGRGVVGGHVFSFETEGQNAARLALRVLAGERPESITISRLSENTYVFDWRQLQRWEIREHSLPPGSDVRFKEVSFWDAYRMQIIGVFTLCAVQTLLIVALLIHRAKRQRAELAERESESRFGTMADAAPTLIWVAGLDKGGTYFNRAWLEFTGRTMQQEVGDGWAEGIHPDDRPRSLGVYQTHFDARTTFEMVYRLRRHDGEYRWVIDRGAPRFTPDGTFVGYIGACTDITDRRRAEDGLRASQRELRELSGRLLDAQEEERRRIARELHDDINQALAFVAVEMDLLGQALPGPSTRTVERVRALSAQVKELSSSVHDLSHQLHPSKLEQLGLVTTVRGLCQELKQHQGLEVTFTQRDVPERIPEAAALCLYRIVQEALRNVIKHAGTRHAVVELSGTPDRVHLRVSDSGAGFDPSANHRYGGLGLISMRERLNLVGGKLVIHSRPGGGTRIDVCVSLGERSDPWDGEFVSHSCDGELLTVGPTGEPR